MQQPFGSGSEDSETKFILSDHPVTVYNHGVDLAAPDARGSLDPSIALKGSQTIFPLSRDFCLILTNLEYAKDPDVNPVKKRTFARNYRNSMVRTDVFIRERRLSNDDVIQINMILKARARRYIAAGRAEWLHPEKSSTAKWRDLGAPLLPPNDALWSFGGKMYARFDDGSVHYQDEFGRSEKPFDALQRTPSARLRGADACGCGSARPYRSCCESRPADARPSWTDLSIRERNLALYRATVDILEITPETSWLDVRQRITDDKISRLYSVYTAFWPRETDLLRLLPKPDGRSRAVYSGSIHPSLINEFAIGAALYFGEILIEHPFVHAGTIRKEFSPVENPRVYRQEILKAVRFLLILMPLIDAGIVNLVPDPCTFDFHLRDQIMRMSRERGERFKPEVDPNDREFKMIEADARRSMMLAPAHALKRKLKKGLPGLEGMTPGEMIEAVELMKLNDPLVTLQPDSLGGGESGGQFNMLKLAPNFEGAMYLAQATGASIITDSRHRWMELMLSMALRNTNPIDGAPDLARVIVGSDFAFPQDEMDVLKLSLSGITDGYAPMMAGVSKYLTMRAAREPKPNFEAQLAARFGRVHASAQAAMVKLGLRTITGKLQVAFPASGIRDNTVNRLLLMSSSERHLPSLPMAFYMHWSTT